MAGAVNCWAMVSPSASETDNIRSPVPPGFFKRTVLGFDGQFAACPFDRFVAAPPSESESAEQLEQLRALELGLVIRCVEVETAAIGVDTPADLERVEVVLKRLDAERISP